MSRHMAEPPGLTLMSLTRVGLSHELARLGRLAERAAHDVTQSLRPIEDGWAQLGRHLTTHLTVQATVLWDRVDEAGVPRCLAAERARLVPAIERVDAAVHYRHIDRLTVNARALAAAVDAHLGHQHRHVLPLARRLRARDWLTVRDETRRLLGGIDHVTRYWYWLTDVAEATGDPHAQAVVHAEMPLSIRALSIAGGQRRYRCRYRAWRRT